MFQKLKLATVILTAVSVFALFLNLPLLAQTAQPSQPQQSQKNITETASVNNDFSTLVSLIKTADLADSFASDRTLTVFAPTNEAFNKIPKETLAKLQLPENLNSLKKILNYHTLEGSIDSTQLSMLTTANTIERSTISISNQNNTIKINDVATVITPNIKTTNGLIHAIDSVLIPPTVIINDLNPSPDQSPDSGMVRSGGSSTVSMLGYFSVVLVLLSAAFMSVKELLPSEDSAN